MCWLQFAAVSATTARPKKTLGGGRRSSPFFDTHVSETKRTLSTRDVERATTGGGSNAWALSKS